MKFVDVKNDVAFHKIFGNAHKTVTLISFLNTVIQLEGKERVVSVKIENPYMFPSSHGGKTVVIDIRATDELDRHFIVEMQVADKEGFDKRTQFYAARDYAAQIEKGEEYIKLRPTYFIGILNYSFTANPNYYSHHQTIDVVTGECLLKDIQYFFIELPKFKKKLGELRSLMDKWTFFIKNSEKLDIIPSDVTDVGLKEAYIEADKHNWQPAELNAYIDASTREGDQEQERKKAEEVGRQKAEAKAELEKIEMVLKMETLGMSIQAIAIVVNKSEAEVQQILLKSKK